MLESANLKPGLSTQEVIENTLHYLVLLDSQSVDEDFTRYLTSEYKNVIMSMFNSSSAK